MCVLKGEGWEGGGGGVERTGLQEQQSAGVKIGGGLGC